MLIIVHIQISVGPNSKTSHNDKVQMPIYKRYAHHSYNNPIAYPKCKFVTSQARWSYHSTTHPALGSPPDS